MKSTHRVYDPAAMTRRELLRMSGLSLGGIALTSLFGRDRLAAAAPVKPRFPNFPPRAKHVIFLNMLGGPSQIDLFDPKPKLNELDGQPAPESLMEGRKFAFLKKGARLLGSPYKFSKHGKCGAELSELLPHLGKVVDDICIVRTMQTEEFNHASGELFMQTGYGRLGRPTFGSWLSYGLGSLNDNLPCYVCLGAETSPASGANLWSGGFLPTVHQGVALRSSGDPILYLGNPPGIDHADRGELVSAANELNRQHHDAIGDPEIQTRIAQYEMAYRMQSSVPELARIENEPPHVLEMYGAKPGDGSFASKCLLARRLVERGVRFVQVLERAWDHHESIYKSLPGSCRNADQASAALVLDLKQRGLLDDTLIIWGGEFGRTPMNQIIDPKRNSGRDHHRDAFSIWMAGGGVKGGLTYGTTDEFGFAPTDHPVHVHDLHATALHLLGIDHEQLTYRHQGRRFRLTDVHGTVVDDLLA